MNSRGRTADRFGAALRKKVGGLALAALVAVFSPSFYTVFWHLRHGSTVSYVGKSVRIPWRWIVYSSDYTQATVLKLPSTLLFGTRPLSGITIRRAPRREGTTQAEAAENWYRVQVAFTSGRDAQSATRSEEGLTCVQTAPKN